MVTVCLARISGAVINLVVLVSSATLHGFLIDKFAAFQIMGDSVISADLFVETAPSDPDKIRPFVCRN